MSATRTSTVDLAVGVASLLIAAGLAFTVQSSLHTTELALESVDHGAASVMMRQVATALFELGGPPREEELQDVLHRFEAEGLKYVALLPPGGVSAIEAGTRSVEVAPHGEMRRRGGRVLLSAPLPPPRGGPPPGRGGARPLPPQLVVEIESALSESLLADARRTMWAGALASGLLLLAGPVIVMLLRKSRRQQAAQHEQAELAALGRMSAVVAHEIRNPLASLKGHAQLLAERLEAPRDLKKAERVVEEAQRLEGLVKGLLTFLRSNRIDTREVDPRVIVADFGDRARVQVDVGAAPKNWCLDPDRLRQVVSNLVDNALEASDGPVEVELRGEPARLVLEVRDRGPGLPEGQDVFEPFVTTKTTGTGLGLAVARAIVAAHGGEIRAEPRTGGGAVLRLWLPGGHGSG